MQEATFPRAESEGFTGSTFLLFSSLPISFETTEAGVAVTADVFDLEPAFESFKGALLPRAGGALLYLEGGYETCIELV